MRAIATERNWEKLSDIQRESLHMFAHKMGRIAVGNPDEPDHWRDIAGYAVLVEKRLTVNSVAKICATGKLRTPEDGGQHASLVPWIKKKCLIDMHEFWEPVNAELYRLRTHLPFKNKPLYPSLYTLLDRYWILKINECPLDARSMFPVLPLVRRRDLEHLIPDWQKLMYQINKVSDQTMELRSQFLSWHTE